MRHVSYFIEKSTTSKTLIKSEKKDPQCLTKHNKERLRVSRARSAIAPHAASNLPKG